TVRKQGATGIRDGGRSRRLRRDAPTRGEGHGRATGICRLQGAAARHARASPATPRDRGADMTRRAWPEESAALDWALRSPTGPCTIPAGPLAAERSGVTSLRETDTALRRRRWVS